MQLQGDSIGNYYVTTPLTPSATAALGEDEAPINIIEFGGARYVTIYLILEGLLLDY